MVEYLLLFSSALCFTAQFLFTKLYEQSIKQVPVTSLAFFTISSIVNVILLLIINGFQCEITAFSLWLALLTAVVYLLYQVISIKILSLGNVGIYSMFMMLGGMVLPFVYGVLFLREPLSTAKIIGLILLTFALVFQVWGEKTSQSTKKLFYALCFVIFVINGLTGVLGKVHQINTAAVDTESYMILYNAVGIVLGACSLLATVLQNREKAQTKTLIVASLRYKPLSAAVLCACAAAIGNFLLLIAALTVPASVQFPIISGGTIVFTVIGALIFYKEKPDVKGVICLIVAFVSTFLFMY